VQVSDLRWRSREDRFMPIRRPGRVLFRNIPLAFVSKKVSGHGPKEIDVEIPLVPFIDLQICLVVFLLMSFSASGELVAQRASLAELEVAPVVAIDPVVITLDGRRMADTASLASDPKVERIEPLINDLETLKRNWSILHPQQLFPGSLVVQADTSIDYRVIKKLMFSAAQAGYANLSFVVNRVGTKK
jgi:biopolymer transport protein ExbD